MHQIVGLAVVVVTLAWGQVAQATPITYNFGGTITFSSSPAIPTSTTFLGSVTYNPVQSTSCSSSNSFGCYALANLSATIGGQTASGAQTASTSVNTTGVWVFRSSTFNTVTFRTSSLGGTLGGVTPSEISLQLFTSVQFSSTALPSTLASLGSWGSTNFRISGLPSNGIAQGSLTSLTLAQPTPVPEPATLLLLSTGLAAVGYRRWRKP